jgi:hypothetical protein
MTYQEQMDEMFKAPSKNAVECTSCGDLFTPSESNTVLVKTTRYDPPERMCDTCTELYDRA